MKKLLLFLVVLAAMSAHLKADVILSDTFNYPDGPLTLAPGSPWKANSSSGTGPVTITNGQIRVSFDGTEDVNALLLNAPYNTISNAAVAALYASFTICFAALPSGQGGFLAHFMDNGGSNFRCRLYALTRGTNAAGTFKLGIASTNAASTSLGFAAISTDLNTNTPYTVVMRISILTGESTLWIDPTSEADGSISSTANPGAVLPISRFAFRQASGIGASFIDNLRVGTAFNDVAGANSPPTLSSIPNQNTPANTWTASIPFTIGDAETPAAELVVSGSSSDQAKVSDENIVFSGSGIDRFLTILPNPGQEGAITIKVAVTDGTDQTTSTSFLLTIGAPSVSEILNQSTPINTTSEPIAFLVNDTETAAGDLVVTASSANTNLVPNGHIVLGGSGSNRTITLIPSLNQTGNSTITVSVSDGTQSASASFVLTVHPVFGLVKSDDFNRSDGPIVDGTGVWWHHSGTLQDAQLSGGQLKLSAALTEDVSTDLTNAPYLPASGAILYAGFKITFTTNLPTSSGSYFAHFKDDGAASFRARLFASTLNAAAGSLRLGIANTASSISASGQFPLDLSTGVTYAVITRYNVGTGISTLWVDPASEASPGITAMDSPSLLAISTYAFRQNAGIGALCVDDLKVAGNFADVLSAPLRLRITRGGTGLQLSWPVSAAGYVLQSTDSLSPPSWRAAAELSTTQGDDNVVQISSITGSRFFRLAK